MESHETNELELRQAARDLADIRRAIESVQQRLDGEPYLFLSPLHVRLHVAALLGSAALILLYLVDKEFVVNVVYSGVVNEWGWRYLMVGVVALVVAAAAAIFYVIIWREARRRSEPFAQYVRRHFIYLRNLSFLSDLFVKLIALSLTIFAGRPDWAAPLLCIFIGDYLVQGRFFILPARVGVVLGLLSMAFGAVYLLFFFLNIVWPLLMFCAVCAASLVNILLLKRRAALTEERE